MSIYFPASTLSCLECRQQPAMEHEEQPQQPDDLAFLLSLIMDRITSPTIAISTTIMTISINYNKPPITLTAKATIYAVSI